MKLGNILTFMAASAVVLGCAGNAKHACVKPLPAGYEPESLTDATVPAAFTDSDINWDDKTITINVYSEDLYDVVELHQMVAGDTLIYNGDTLIVNTIEDKDGMYIINGGLEEGGADLKSNEGGTYKAVEYDDHSTYSDLGKVTLPLDDNFALVVCGSNPTDPYDTIKTEQKAYLDTVADYKKNFSFLDTQVLIEGGKVTNITRVWIP